MKLYTYDHCPFCIRARMILALHQIPFEHIILLNDDETTPNKLIGAKMVPILVKDDGTAMGESLDIVTYIEAQAPQPLLTAPVRDVIKNWSATLGRDQHHLVMPRLIKIGLPEFATAAAVTYFVKKKTELIGDFQESFYNTTDYLYNVNQSLKEISPYFQSDEAVNGTLGYEDIYLFPVLRSLSCVQPLDFPDNIRNYMEKMSERTNISLYFDRAI